MASTNMELVRSISALWERGDYRSADWAHPEIEYVIPDGPAPGSWSGPAAMSEGYVDFLGAWADHRTLVEGYLELDDERVLVLQRIAGRGRRSGVELGDLAPKGASLFHIRDGKVTRLVIYFDRAHALADAGLAPESAGG